MDWKSIKASQDVRLDGITVFVTRTNGSIDSIELVDAAGHRLRLYSTYGLSVSVPAEPEKRKMTVLRGEIAGVPVETKVEGAPTEYGPASKSNELAASGVENIVATEVLDDIPF